MTQVMPLSEDERAVLNSASTHPADRMRLYARDLRATAEAYAVAADAPGLRKDAAKYLFRESLRLTTESGHAFDRADVLESRRAVEHRDDGQCHRDCWDRAVAEMTPA